MAPKILAGLAKMMVMPMPKQRRNRRTSPTIPSKTTPSVDMMLPNKPSLTKTNAAVGNSCSTCGSSGYFSDQSVRQVQVVSDTPTSPEVRRHSTTTGLSQTLSQCQPQSSSSLTTTTTIQSPASDGGTIIAWGGSSDAGPESPAVAPRSRRCRSQSVPQGECLNMTMLYHDKVTSLRLRKRNRALSDVDFDQLLTMSRGWTFDPACTADLPPTRRRHVRQKAMGQTDFERYIFAPRSPGSLGRSPPSSIRSLPTSFVAPLLVLPKPEELGHGDEEWVHPFFRPDDPTWKSRGSF